ncbi:MAG: hypothetical protein ACTHKJ_04540 [Candidatus Nitrosocosmicus sp.]
MSRKEKENRVIHLAHEGKTRTEIAKQAHVSLKHWDIICKKIGDDNNETKK